MARFDVLRNRDSGTARSVPCFLDVQSDLLGRIDSRIVIPLIQIGSAPRINARLNPEFQIGERRLMLLTQDLFSAEGDLLGARIASLRNHAFEVTNALDMLFEGI